METTNARARSEGGQTLILFVLGLAVLLGFVAMTIDVGLAFMERRNLQNAVDAAALAAAQDFVNGESEATATATAIDYVQRHGFAALGDAIEVSIPPTSGQYAGLSGYVEVTASSEAPPAFVLLFLDAPYTLSARSVAQGALVTESSGGGGGGGAPPPPAIVPSNVACGGPTVDGRVTAGDGYTKVADLGAGASDYGDVFVACDANHYYFAMRLNGPSTGGAVANENVYGCELPKTAEVRFGGFGVRVRGPVATVNPPSLSFTIDVDGQLWMVEVDGTTEFKGGAGIDDLTLAESARVEGTLVGPERVLASEVSVPKPGQCTAADNPNYHADYNTGWSTGLVKDHSYAKLEGSDRARFQLACDGVVRHDFVQDYLREAGPNWKSDTDPLGDGSVIAAGPTASASSLEWNLEHPDETGWGDDPGEDPLRQSPPFNPTYPSYSVEYSGWVWEMIYEFKVPKQPYYANCSGPIEFRLPSFPGQTGPVGGIHSSPAKAEEATSIFLIGEDKVLKLVE